MSQAIVKQSDHCCAQSRWIRLRMLCPPNILQLALQRLVRNPVDAAARDGATLSDQPREAWQGPCQGRGLQPRAASGRFVENQVEPTTIVGCDFDIATSNQDLVDGWPAPKH